MKDSYYRSLSFAANLLRTIQNESGNLTVSPCNVEAALALLALGAREDTLNGLLRALSFHSVDDMVSAISAETKALRNQIDDGFRVESDQSLWVRNDIRLLREYERNLRATFDTKIRPVHMDESGRRTINRHVAHVTHNKIRDLLSNPFSGSEMLVATTALWLKADWREPFLPENTWDAAFHAPDGHVSVPFMHRTDVFQCWFGGDVAAISIPYAHNGIDLAVFIPRGTTPLSEFLAKPDFGDILAQAWQCLDESGGQRVALAFPKLHLSFSDDLVPALGKMGAASAFSSDADLSGIAGTDRPLFVSNVLHRVQFDLDEDGTEAAAATAEIVRAGCPPPEHLPRPIPFRVNKPFLFAVRDLNAGSLLFAGHVENPSEGNA